MKCRTVVDKEREEEVVIYTKGENPLVKEIESLVNGKNVEFLGYKDADIVKIQPSEVYCFSVVDTKVCAILERETFTLKQRLYAVEEMLKGNKDFVKINQSCLANIKKIERFDTSLSGTLVVKFKNGYKDYVSRRQMKIVKERIGF